MATMLDPDIQRLLDTVFNVPIGAEAPDVAQLRATAEAVPARLGGEPEAVASITDAFAPGEHELLPVRIYRPAAAELLPLVVYAHGGGWVNGSL
jgi:acetyl esterase